MTNRSILFLSLLLTATLGSPAFASNSQPTPRSEPTPPQSKCGEAERAVSAGRRAAAVDARPRLGPFGLDPFSGG